MIPSMPTEFALQLTAGRQRELESRAARRRLVHHLATTNCDRPIDAVSRAMRRITTGFPVQHRRPVATGGAVRCCAA